MFCPRNYRNYATQILSLFVAVILDTVTGVLPTWIESVSGGENNCSSRFVWDASKAFAAQSASQPRPASQPASQHRIIISLSSSLGHTHNNCSVGECHDARPARAATLSDDDDDDESETIHSLRLFRDL